MDEYLTVMAAVTAHLLAQSIWSLGTVTLPFRPARPHRLGCLWRRDLSIVHITPGRFILSIHLSTLDPVRYAEEDEGATVAMCFGLILVIYGHWYNTEG